MIAPQSLNAFKGAPALPFHLLSRWLPSLPRDDRNSPKACFEVQYQQSITAYHARNQEARSKFLSTGGRMASAAEQPLAQQCWELVLAPQYREL